MPQTDAIAALQKAAEEAGIDDVDDFVEALSDIWFTYLCKESSMDAVTMREEGIQAAHAVIVWWKRRGWVKCPVCKGKGYVNALHIRDWFDEHRTYYCDNCNGEGRVPLTDIERANVAAILRTQQIIDDINDKE